MSLDGSPGPDRDDGCAVVALCASAGGFDAFSRVLAALPLGFPAAVIVLQHQEPARDSHLAGLLRRRSVLPVREAADGDRLARSEVLVVPPGTHMLVGRDARVCLVRSGDIPPARPSADLLLCTAAAALGPRLIAVILTGAGHDGAIGAAAVHAFGGQVLVQNPATAFAPGMPSAAIERDAPQSVELADVARRLSTLLSERSEPLQAVVAHDEPQRA